MKVLHVTEALGGGVSTAILNYQALTPEMHHCVIARERAGQSTYNFPSELSVTLVPGSVAALLLSAIRMVRRGDFDILHLHSSLAGLARIIPGHRAGIVYTPHCYAFERTDVSPLARVLYKSVERGLLSIRRQVRCCREWTRSRVDYGVVELLHLHRGRQCIPDRSRRIFARKQPSDSGSIG